MTPDPTTTPRTRIRRAISDPGHVTPRGDGETELEWKARAVEEALGIEEERADWGGVPGRLRRLVTPWEEVREP